MNLARDEVFLAILGLVADDGRRQEHSSKYILETIHKAAYLRLLVLQLRVPWHEQIMSCGYIIPWDHHTYLFCTLSPYLDSQFLFVTTGCVSGYHLFLFFMFICSEYTAYSLDHPSKPCLKRKRINIQTIFWKLGMITRLYKWCHVA